MDYGTQAVYDSKAPRIARRLAQDIAGGRFPQSSMLPPERELARSYGISRMTMRKVLSMLAERGDLVKVPQRGVMVAAGAAPIVSQTPTATALSRNGRSTIAAVWAAEPDVHLVDIREGVKRYAAENDLAFQMFLSSQGHDQALRVLDEIRDHPVDGVLVLPYASDDYVQALDRLVEHGFPVVCIDRQVSAGRASSVEVDNAAGVYQATRYLIEKHHRPVHFLSTALEHEVQQNRHLGYCRAMADAGFGGLVRSHSIIRDIRESDPTFWPMDRKPTVAAPLAEALLQSAGPPMSVICLNDYIAAGLYEAVAARGLSVGRDLAVVGFDDLPLARFLRPALTTIRQPRQQIGYEGAKLLHQLIAGRLKPPVNIHLPVEFIVRDSA